METKTLPFTGRYEIDPVHSTVQFAVSHIVSTFRASFQDVTGNLVAGDGESVLAATGAVESVSIAGPSDFRQHVVNGDDFFDAGTYPQISFRSTDLRFDDDGHAVVAGVLTIRDIACTVTAVGSYTGPTLDPFGGERRALRLAATIDRRDWGLTWQMSLPMGGEAVGWEVELTAELELVRSAAE